MKGELPLLTLVLQLRDEMVPREYKLMQNQKKKANLFQLNSLF